MSDGICTPGPRHLEMKTCQFKTNLDYKSEAYFKRKNIKYNFMTVITVWKIMNLGNNLNERKL